MPSIQLYMLTPKKFFELLTRNFLTCLSFATVLLYCHGEHTFLLPQWISTVHICVFLIVSVVSPLSVLDVTAPLSLRRRPTLHLIVSMGAVELRMSSAEQWHRKAGYAFQCACSLSPACDTWVGGWKSLYAVGLWNSIFSITDDRRVIIGYKPIIDFLFRQRKARR